MLLNNFMNTYTKKEYYSSPSLDLRGIAIYARESTREQAIDGYNLEGQQKKAKEYISYKGLKGDIKLYVEFGKSAKTTNRKELNRLKQDIKDRKIKMIIVQKLDRLTRRLEGLSEIIKLINEYDVQLISLNEDINTQNAMGRFFINLVVMIAEWEQDTISERTNDGLINGAEQGNYVIGGKSVFGWKRCTVDGLKLLEQVPKEVEILRKMYKYLKNGYSCYSISLMINEETYMKEIGKKVNDVQVANLLSHIVHTARFELKGKIYTMPIKPIFTDEEFKEIKSLLKAKEKTSKYDYLFDKKVYTKNGKFAVNKSTVKKDNAILYYFDNDNKKRINENFIKKEVLDYLQLNETLYTFNRNRSYENDIKRLSKKKEKVINLYLNNKISHETYENELHNIQSLRKDIDKKYKEYVKCIHSYFDNMKYDDKKFLIEKNIHRIEVDFNNKQVLSIS